MHHQLEKILAEKRNEVAALKKSMPFKRDKKRPPLINFKAAVSVPQIVSLIAEIKFASPSAGLIRQKADPVSIGCIYQDAGAAAISLLTDQRFFQGDLDQLPRLKKAISLPILRKDFIIDAVQIRQSFFLRRRCAPSDRTDSVATAINRIHCVVPAAGMTPLIEVHNGYDLEKAVVSGAEIIGINNRDLETFKVDIHITFRLAPLVPNGCIIVSESGITSLKDASMAVQFGADALGFIFAPSPRRIAPQTARKIIRAVSPFVKTVGGFVDEAAAAVREIMQYCGLDLVQLHGDESPAFCHKLMPHTIKALRIKDESALQTARAYHGKVRALLLDAYSREMAGGTGKTFDWELAIRIKKQGTPIILSGGLGPSNIVAAIHTVRPYAVDVNSGVETHPGRKSHTLIRDLTEKVRQETISEYKILEGECSDD